jgi:hypothetical protein
MKKKKKIFIKLDFKKFFFFFNDFYFFIKKIISQHKSRLSHGRDALMLLTLLLQYQKYESENPYIGKLSILDDELALTVSSSQLIKWFEIRKTFNF